MTTLKTEKLQKALARSGLGSRREMELWIQAKRVQINDKPAELGDRIHLNDRIHVDNKLINISVADILKTRVLVYNKPVGEICSTSTPDTFVPNVFQNLPRVYSGRWISIGRLDINSQGLLLFTTDGELAHRMMHPSSNIDREYAVRVLGEVTGVMMERLKKGVVLADGAAKFSDVHFSGGTGANRWYHVTLMEGRKREVRRLWETQGVKVSRLKRVRFGPVIMPSFLKLGRLYEMQPFEVAALHRLVGIPNKLKTKQNYKSDSKVLIRYPGLSG